jgi:hypothetical protein
VCAHQQPLIQSSAWQYDGVPVVQVGADESRPMHVHGELPFRYPLDVELDQGHAESQTLGAEGAGDDGTPVAWLTNGRSEESPKHKQARGMAPTKLRQRNHQWMESVTVSEEEVKTAGPWCRLRRLAAGEECAR